MTDHERGLDAAALALANRNSSNHPASFRGIAEAAISAYLATTEPSKPVAEAVKVTDGWQLVPKTPTREMIDAWRMDQAQSRSLETSYRAMLDAAPSHSGNAEGAAQVPAELIKLTFAVQHNPNCPSPWLVRLPGNGPIDMLPYGDPLGLVRHQTGDILGFGKTFGEAARAALSNAPEVKP